MAKRLFGIVLLIIGVWFMSRGYPDWQVQTGQSAYVEFDAGELAARLGSVNTFRRSGRVLYATGFEGLVTGIVNDWSFFVPAGSSGYIAPFIGEGSSGKKQPYHGATSLAIVPTDVADADGVMRTNAIKLLPALWSGRLGVEMEVAAHENSQGFMLDISWDDSTTIRTAGIWVNFLTDRILYRSSSSGYGAGSFTDLAALPGGQWESQAGVSLRWGNLKLIVASDLTQYHNLLLNNRNFATEIRGLAVPTAVPVVTAFERISIQVNAIDDDGTNGPLYIDDVIVTNDEP
jgi:hypothetical protein